MKNKKSSMKKKSTTIRAMQSNRGGDRCGAYARSTGCPCKAKAMSNGRCKNHGGMSTGPKTAEGRKVIAEATRHRMATGQRKRVLEGFYAWLEGGGREILSGLAKARERRKRWRRLMLD
jgi:hypothetical protein